MKNHVGYTTVSPYFLKKERARLVEEVEAIAAIVRPEELPLRLEELVKVKMLALDKAMKVRAFTTPTKVIPLTHLSMPRLASAGLNE